MASTDSPNACSASKEERKGIMKKEDLFNFRDGSSRRGSQLADQILAGKGTVPRKVHFNPRKTIYEPDPDDNRREPGELIKFWSSGKDEERNQRYIYNEKMKHTVYWPPKRNAGQAFLGGQYYERMARLADQEARLADQEAPADAAADAARATADVTERVAVIEPDVLGDYKIEVISNYF